MKSSKQTPEFDRTWLVQRLSKPHGPALGFKDNPFSFGGGLHNGGLSSAAMDLLRGGFSFDYMGSSEFEWGAVPKTLNLLAQADLTAFRFSIPLAEVAPNWRERKAATPSGEGVVFVLCPTVWREQVETRIRELAAKEGDTKEFVELAAALRPSEGWDTRSCGWLELDNGFMFFTDEAMWAATCSLFNVAAQVSA